ncbi:hypothetical protein NI382_08975 [Vibrio parahaemolyticus]|uniref:hypothetical protein n=1 Tax=Vibrio parahaemolyticus TaxID=670 RepID=UPI001122306C|nr:hypothetical protein [Vibrio parahaemolyticus]MDF4355247.1 hypothetical protein [Vibrio parahaemolyticus]TOP98630.1 hypothetical protein CGH05_20800 [Vibrio parahaemolyticus]WMN86289.1 hypothetical protein NI382_08975 [Vibrio parahaemolyticus]HCE3465150.1 hypothetical protein [Vibrio parahaemolyticus]HCE4999951.1 hypothetical protein [Vibrio parahaemolyticus]
MFSKTFNALADEATFTKEMLGSGATQIRKGNYASKGNYFQAFTSLSTGLERIGKLCLMLDYYIDNDGKFPDFHHLKKQIGHDLELLYKRSQEIIQKRGIKLKFLQNLDSEIHQNILVLLSEFAKGDRYSNINYLVNSKQQSDPIAKWYESVDVPLYEMRVTNAKKQKIEQHAHFAEQMMGQFTMVRHRSEDGSNINSVYEGSYRAGVFEAVAPYRQLCVLEMIRYWVVLLWELQYKAMALHKEEIPYFSEIFGGFYNENSYLRTRKTWDTI